MTTASATVSPAMIRTAAMVSPRSPSSQRRRTRVKYISGLNSFDGLKACKNLTSLGLPDCTEKCFAKIVSSLRKPSKGSYGGALAATCSAVAEIFRIAAIMPALVLIGVAVGFVLLRLEASLEEE